MPWPFHQEPQETEEHFVPRLQAHWSHARDPASLYAALMKWLDRNGLQSSALGEGFTGEPHVCGLTAGAARVCLKVKATPPWKSCDVRTLDGKWYLVIG